MREAMSAKGGLCTMVCGFALWSATSAAAQDNEPADMTFVEYLGLWEEADEDWLLLEEIAVADNEKRSDPAPEGEEPTELEDES